MRVTIFPFTHAPSPAMPVACSNNGKTDSINIEFRHNTLILRDEWTISESVAVVPAGPATRPLFRPLFRPAAARGSTEQRGPAGSRTRNKRS